MGRAVVHSLMGCAGLGAGWGRRQWRFPIWRGSRHLLQDRAFHSPAGERVAFLCSCKEKSPKETRPRHRTCAARKCPALLAGAGPARTRASLRSDRRAFPPSPAAMLGAVKGEKIKSTSKSTARALDLALDLRAPFATASARRKGPQGGRDGSRPVRCQHQGRAVSEPRSALAHLRGFTPQAWQRGCISLGYFSLGKQREVTRSPQARGTLFPEKAHARRQASGTLSPRKLRAVGCAQRIKLHNKISQPPGGNSRAQAAHQILVIMQIVDRRQHRSEHLAAFVEVTQVGAAESRGTGVAGAGFIERSRVAFDNAALRMRSTP